jgi:hypothetical protein
MISQVLVAFTCSLWLISTILPNKPSFPFEGYNIRVQS